MENQAGNQEQPKKRGRKPGVKSAAVKVKTKISQDLSLPIETLISELKKAKMEYIKSKLSNHIEMVQELEKLKRSTKR